MAQLKATSPSTTGEHQTFIHPSLSTSTHVFVRRDSVKRPLQRPYDGPYKILHRTDKYFTIDLQGRRDNVSIDRLKPAYFESPNPMSFPHNSSPTHFPTALPASNSNRSESDSAGSDTNNHTRIGRRVRFPNDSIYRLVCQLIIIILDYYFGHYDLQALREKYVLLLLLLLSSSLLLLLVLLLLSLLLLLLPSFSPLSYS